MLENAIVRQPGTAVWKQIQAALADDVLAGRLTGRLPNETALAERFAVNRHTVRQAVKALVEQGLLDVVHGRGTFVREDFLDYQIGRRTRLAHSVVKARRVGKSEILGWEAVRPSAEIAALLELPSRAKALAVSSLDVVDEKVIGVCTQYFPLPRFDGFGEAYAAEGKTHLALARFGVQQFQRRLSRITARLPSPDIAQRLAQPVAQPVLFVETVYVDQDDKPIEYGISNFSSTAVQLVIEPD